MYHQYQLRRSCSLLDELCHQCNVALSYADENVRSYIQTPFCCTERWVIILILHEDSPSILAEEMFVTQILDCALRIVEWYHKRCWRLPHQHALAIKQKCCRILQMFQEMECEDTCDAFAIKLAQAVTLSIPFWPIQIINTTSPFFRPIIFDIAGTQVENWIITRQWIVQWDDMTLHAPSEYVNDLHYRNTSSATSNA